MTNKIYDSEFIEWVLAREMSLASAAEYKGYKYLQHWDILTHPMNANPHEVLTNYDPL